MSDPHCNIPASKPGAIYRNFTKNLPVPKAGDLRVWWIPQIPGKTFQWPVADLAHAGSMLDALAAYDDFLFAGRIRGDYSNTGGLERFDGEDWCEWESDDCDDFDTWRRDQEMIARGRIE